MSDDTNIQLAMIVADCPRCANRQRDWLLEQNALLRGDSSDWTEDLRVGEVPCLKGSNEQICQKIG